MTSSAICQSSTSRHTVLHWLSMFDRRVFSVAGPSVWNSLPDTLRNSDINSVKHLLTRTCFQPFYLFSHLFYLLKHQHIRGSTMMSYIILRFTYLLTYLLTWLRVYRRPIHTHENRSSWSIVIRLTINLYSNTVQTKATKFLRYVTI